MSKKVNHLKPIKAEMLPNLRLRITFNNNEVRYMSRFTKVDLFIQPLANTWIGNEIKILEDGSIMLNKLHIPYEAIIEQSTGYLEEENRTL
ncbi:hypothetical protein [Vagococcus xieshaowenii]|uniref:Uncharacterized protein n=1 Tax=Vagococcus xieshaowenii TaxID=2562451 RepID=A0AAJ5EGA0_9ENTE|nr:hypothetical protein [Vagococcus xieshaowenii]QCA27964.1 hypothetical protein E4Z98_00830 [Vagococcus xieshaowenii]TFZ41269.1 hypothetical protein E4031_05295 [Vagococcus xieshaowenii]